MSIAKMEYYRLNDFETFATQLVKTFMKLYLYWQTQEHSPNISAVLYTCILRGLGGVVALTLPMARADRILPTVRRPWTSR